MGGGDSVGSFVNELRSVSTECFDFVVEEIRRVWKLLLKSRNNTMHCSIAMKFIGNSEPRLFG